MLEEENDNLKSLNTKLESDVKHLLDKTYRQSVKIESLKRVVKELKDINSSPIRRSDLYEDIKDYVHPPTWTRQQILGAPVEKFPDDGVERE